MQHEELQPNEAIGKVKPFSSLKNERNWNFHVWFSLSFVHSSALFFMELLVYLIHGQPFWTCPIPTSEVHVLPYFLIMIVWIIEDSFLNDKLGGGHELVILHGHKWFLSCQLEQAPLPEYIHAWPIGVMLRQSNMNLSTRYTREKLF